MQSGGWWYIASTFYTTESKSKIKHWKGEAKITPIVYTFHVTSLRGTQLCFILYFLDAEEHAKLLQRRQCAGLRVQSKSQGRGHHHLISSSLPLFLHLPLKSYPLRFSKSKLKTIRPPRLMANFRRCLNPPLPPRAMLCKKNPTKLCSQMKNFAWPRERERERMAWQGRGPTGCSRAGSDAIRLWKRGTRVWARGMWCTQAGSDVFLEFFVVWFSLRAKRGK